MRTLPSTWLVGMDTLKLPKSFSLVAYYWQSMQTRSIMTLNPYCGNHYSWGVSEPTLVMKLAELYRYSTFVFCSLVPNPNWAWEWEYLASHQLAKDSAYSCTMLCFHEWCWLASSHTGPIRTEKVWELSFLCFTPWSCELASMLLCNKFTQASNVAAYSGFTRNVSIHYNGAFVANQSATV